MYHNKKWIACLAATVRHALGLHGVVEQGVRLPDGGAGEGWPRQGPSFGVGTETAK